MFIISEIPNDLLSKIAELNHLDAELYDFARELFFQRYRQIVQFNPEESQSENNVISFEDWKFQTEIIDTCSFFINR